jgi:diaminopimelate decarboxylase
MIADEIFELTNSIGTPFYAYDLGRVTRRLDTLERIPVRRKALYFATMANDHPSVLAHILAKGHGVFVNSPKHLQVVLGLGFRGNRVVYASSNMTDNEMRLCANNGVRLILDSLGQVTLFADVVGSGHEIGIRINVGSVRDQKWLRHEPSYRFGILPEEISTALDIANSGRLKIVGVHSYFGTDICSPKLLLKGLRALCIAAEHLPDLAYIDTAGGFAASGEIEGQEFDVHYYGVKAAQIINQFEAKYGREVELSLEPGRFISADCGFFFVTVTDIKERSDRLFVGTNGSVAIFPRRLLYPESARHPCELINATPGMNLHPLPISICGSSTYSRDILAADVHLQKPRAGDAIVFRNAGAYCRSMITDFLGKDRPNEVVVNYV